MPEQEGEDQSDTEPHEPDHEEDRDELGLGQHARETVGECASRHGNPRKLRTQRKRPFRKIRKTSKENNRSNGSSYPLQCR